MANDLQKVYLLMSRADKNEPIDFSLKETCSEKAEESSLSRGHESTSEDQSSDSSPPTKPQIGQNQSSNLVVPGWKVSLLHELYEHCLFSNRLIALCFNKRLIELYL